MTRKTIVILTAVTLGIVGDGWSQPTAPFSPMIGPTNYQFVAPSGSKLWDSNAPAIKAMLQYYNGTNWTNGNASTFFSQGVVPEVRSAHTITNPSLGGTIGLDAASPAAGYNTLSILGNSPTQSVQLTIQQGRLIVDSVGGIEQKAGQFYGNLGGGTNLQGNAGALTNLNAGAITGITNSIIRTLGNAAAAAVATATPHYQGELAYTYGGPPNGSLAFWIANSTTTGDWLSLGSSYAWTGTFGDETHMGLPIGAGFGGAWQMYANGSAAASSSNDVSSAWVFDIPLQLRQMNMYHHSMIGMDTVKWKNAGNHALGTTMDEYGAAFFGIGNHEDISAALRDVVVMGGNSGRPLGFFTSAYQGSAESVVMALDCGKNNVVGPNNQYPHLYFFDPSLTADLAITNGSGGISRNMVGDIDFHLSSMKLRTGIFTNLSVGQWFNDAVGFHCSTNALFDNDDSVVGWDSSHLARAGLGKKNGQYPMILAASGAPLNFGHSSAADLQSTAVSGQTWTVDANLDSGGGWHSKIPILTKTANYTVAATDFAGWINNSGASQAVTNTLPSATAGVHFGLDIEAGQILAFKASGSDTIRNAGNVSAAAGLIFASTIGNTVHITCHVAGKWIVDSAIGTWTVQ